MKRYLLLGLAMLALARIAPATAATARKAATAGKAQPPPLKSTPSKFTPLKFTPNFARAVTNLEYAVDGVYEKVAATQWRTLEWGMPGWARGHRLRTRLESLEHRLTRLRREYRSLGANAMTFSNPTRPGPRRTRSELEREFKEIKNEYEQTARDAGTMPKAIVISDK